MTGNVVTLAGGNGNVGVRVNEQSRRPEAEAVADEVDPLDTS
jgi:hypothetical protein